LSSFWFAFLFECYFKDQKLSTFVDILLGWNSQRNGAKLWRGSILHYRKFSLFSNLYHCILTYSTLHDNILTKESMIVLAFDAHPLYFDWAIVQGY
jgi:hypothetical protein